MTNTIDLKFDEILDESFETKLDELLAAEEAHFAAGMGSSAATGGTVKQYQTVSPQAKEKLKGILKHYAKDPHPFTACVRDNRKRFGDRAENVCAVLKDIIRDTTKWRGHPSMDKGSPGVSGLSEDTTTLDEEVVALAERLNELDLWTLLSLAEKDAAGVTQEYRNELYKLHPHVKAKPPGGPSVGLKKDHKGFYVHTHRARSKSYPTVAAIPRKTVDFIKSTG